MSSSVVVISIVVLQKIPTTAKATATAYTASHGQAEKNSFSIFFFPGSFVPSFCHLRDRRRRRAAASDDGDGKGTQPCHGQAVKKLSSPIFSFLSWLVSSFSGCRLCSVIVVSAVVVIVVSM